MVCFLGLSGCLTINSLNSSANTLFQPISQNHLVKYEHRLAHLIQSGVKGEALDVARQWLYLMTCHPFPSDLKRPQDPLWGALYDSLILETTRDEKNMGHLAQFSTRFTQTIPKLNQNQWTEWPLNQEGWPDEMPQFIQVPSQCNFLTSGYPQQKLKVSKTSSNRGRSNRLSSSRKVKGSPKKNKKAKPKVTWFNSWPWTAYKALYSPQGWMTLRLQIKQWGALEKTKTSVHILEKHVSSPLPLVSEWKWWLIYTQAQMLSIWSKVELGWPIPKEVPLFEGYVYRRACALWQTLFYTSTPPRLMKGWQKARSQVALMTGLCMEAQERRQEALEVWSKVDIQTFEGEAMYLTQYHRVRVLSQLGQWQHVIQMKDQAPPKQSQLFPPYTYLVGLAYSMMGDAAGLMGFSTALFRDRGWRKDPFLRALFYLFVRSLTQYNFEERVIELLEDLGPRYETYERVFAFAQVAIDEGQIRQAEDAAYWLLNHHENAQWTPRYESVLALVAFYNDRPIEFVDTLKRISPVESSLLDAIPRGRRSVFFEQQDQALVDVIQALLPRLAELNRQQYRFRNKWLNHITAYIQSFLRLRKDSKSRGELTSLYRISRQMLNRRSVRSYSERIGKDQVDTLVLGQVRVQSTQLDPFEPRNVSLHFTWPWTLTLIPTLEFSPLKWGLNWTN